LPSSSPWPSATSWPGAGRPTAPPTGSRPEKTRAPREPASPALELEPPAGSKFATCAPAVAPASGLAWALGPVYPGDDRL
jgi:hypothetical protein